MYCCCFTKAVYYKQKSEIRGRSCENYITVAQAAEQWGVSDRRVRILCQQDKIDGVIRKGRAWMIPAGAEKPIDGHTTRYQRNASPYEELFAEVDALKAEPDKRRPLTRGEMQRPRDGFLIKYTYNSSAIKGNTLPLQETALVLEGIAIDKKPLKDQLEAVGHRDAFLYVEELVKIRFRSLSTSAKRSIRWC